MTRSRNYLKETHWLAGRYADRPDIVQGAGGNFSVKVDANVMLVKASGREFDEIERSGRGLVPVLYKKLKGYLSSKKARGRDEGTHLNVVRSCTILDDGGNEKPSMEVWFHALLSKYVLHTHSVYVNVLSCSEEGAELFREIVKKAGLSHIVIPYCNPGFELGNLMAKRLRKWKDMPAIVFLENHGIIVTADSARECAKIHDRVEANIKNLLGIKSAAFPQRPLHAREVRDFKSLILFPDQIIYPERADIRAAHRFILKHIKRTGLRVRVIPSAHASAIAHMESEKHRKKLQKIK